MPEYLLTGRSRNGKQETVRIDAPTADLAYKQFQKRGYHDIELHTDDVSAHYTRQSEFADEITPAEYLQFRYFGSWLDDALFVAWKLYNSGWIVYGAAAAFLMFRRIMNWPQGWSDYVALAIAAFPLLFGIGSQLFNATHRYTRMIDALAWGRWEQVLTRLPRVRGSIPPEEAAFCEAQALAGLGRLDEALRILKPFADDQQLPAWLYWGRMGDVYFAAGKPDMIVRMQEKAFELASDNPTVLLDLATSVIRWQRDAERARQLLEQARTHVLSDVLEIFAKMLEGMIDLESGDPARAQMHFEDTLAALFPLRNATPLIGAAIDRTYAYLCLACAAQDELRAARRHFHRAEPRLRALGSFDLLQRCEAALRKGTLST